jgi:hypothetical protein
MQSLPTKSHWLPRLVHPILFHAITAYPEVVEALILLVKNNADFVHSDNSKMVLLDRQVCEMLSNAEVEEDTNDGRFAAAVASCIASSETVTQADTMADTIGDTMGDTVMEAAPRTAPSSSSIDEWVLHHEDDCVDVDLIGLPGDVPLHINVKNLKGRGRDRKRSVKNIL